jgi:hypothetical protein
VRAFGPFGQCRDQLGSAIIVEVHAYFVASFLSPSGSCREPNCAVLDVMSRWASRGEGVCSC